MLDAIAFVVFAAITSVLIVSNIVLRAQKIREDRNSQRLQIANKELKHEILADRVTDMDGFVRFLSESRDSAYSYIDGVQAGIVDLRNAMERSSDEDIRVAYENLLSFLPDSTNEN